MDHEDVRKVAQDCRTLQIDFLLAVVTGEIVDYVPCAIFAEAFVQIFAVFYFDGQEVDVFYGLALVVAV